MHLSQLKADQLEAYLASLTPKAAAFLVREVERDKLRGGDAFPHDLILERVRTLLRGPDDQIERPATPERVFCEPLDDMLVDVSTRDKQKGRIARRSIGPVWEWLSGEVAPDSVARIAEGCRDYDQLPDNRTLGERFAPTYRAMSLAMHAQLDGLTEGSKPYMRLAGRLGGEAVLQDAAEIADCLDAAGELLKARSRLPGKIREITELDTPLYVALYQSFESSCPSQAYMLAISLVRRAVRVADALRLVCSIVGSEEVAIVRDHHLGVVFDAVVRDIEVAGDAVRDAVNARAGPSPRSSGFGRAGAVEEIEKRIRAFHALASGIEEVLELSPSGPWGAPLVVARASVSAAIREQIAPAPRLVKAALFPKTVATPDSGPAGHIVPPDDGNVADAEFAVRLLAATRYYLDQLSINADYNRIRSQVEQFLEAVGERILRELGREHARDREACLRYMEAAGRMTHTMFGEDAAKLYLRRGRAAAQSAEKAHED